MTIKKKLEIVKYNKRIQNRLNLSVKDYKEEYCEIEIEIIPITNGYGKFINIEGDKSYYHIYFNDDKNEIKKYSSIEIEIKTVNNKYSKFINIKDEDEIYYLIYFNNNSEEIKRKYINKYEKILK